MTRLPALTARKLLGALQRAGYSIHHSTGSHYYLKHPKRPEVRITVPYHRGDLKRQTVQSILRQAGMTADQLVELL
jgi:predicted RNA binding protein YcfA (HicA-like mRNA interferase family)